LGAPDVEGHTVFLTTERDVLFGSKVF